MADPSGAWVIVWELTLSPQTTEPPLLLPLWPARQPPLRRPSRDNNVCIFGRSRNDRTGCVPVVHWSEQSLKRVYSTSARATPSLDGCRPVLLTSGCAREPKPRGKCARAGALRNTAASPRINRVLATLTAILPAGWLSLPVRASASTKSSPASARAGWARYSARAIPSSIAMSR